MTEQQQKKPAVKDAGQAEVKSAFEEAQEQGYFGNEVDPTPNKEFSLQSGPDSPTVAEQRAALAKKEG